MFSQFTVSGASLKLLKVGEQGVISRLNAASPAIARQIRALGLSPGMSITVEQRFPRFLVHTCQASVALSQPMIEAIYVRTSP